MMESTNKQLIGTYDVSQPYLTNKEEVHEAQVTLNINYQTKAFSIRPKNGKTDPFSFVDSRGNIKKWKAVVTAIQEAIEFAEKQLSESE